jgi:PAS domain S-box-containing protein
VRWFEAILSEPTSKTSLSAPGAGAGALLWTAPARLAWLAWICALGLAIAASFLLDLTAYQRVLGWDAFYTVASTVAGLQWLGIARSNREAVRAAATWITLGIFVWWVSEVAWFYCEIVGEDWALFPSPVSLGFILMVPLIGIGLVLYIQRAVKSWFSIPLLCDLGIVTAMLVVVIGLPVNDALPPAEIAIRVGATVYPVLCALLVVFSAYCLLAFGWGARRWILVLLLLGVSCIVGADFIFTFATLNPAFDLGDILDPAWAAGFILISLAAFEHRRIVERGTPPTLEAIVLRVRRLRQVLPALALIAIAVTVIAHIGNLDFDAAVWMLLPAVVLLALSSAGLALWNRSQILALQDRKEAAEQALRHSEARFGAVLEFSPDPMLVIDGMRRICAAGKGVESVFGYGRDDMLGQSIDILSRELVTVLPAEKIRELIAIHDTGTLASHRFNATVLRKSGEALPIEGLIFPLNGGTESLFAVVLRDITERLAVEHQLRTARDTAELADRAKSDFLANMSHELRTPLNAIIGFSEIIETEAFGRGDSRYPAYAGDIRQSGQHLLGILKEILDFSRVDTKNVTLRESEIPIPKMVDDCLSMIRLSADANGVAIATDLPQTLPCLFADELKVKQVLLNLLSNAVKFTPQGGRVTVGVRYRPGQELILSVADTGIGMREDDIPLALSPFGQVADAFARNHDGLGLGLPLARHLTELHQGSLEIESRPGAGTMVRVHLPAARLIEPGLQRGFAAAAT